LLCCIFAGAGVPVAGVKAGSFYERKCKAMEKVRRNDPHGFYDTITIECHNKVYKESKQQGRRYFIFRNWEFDCGDPYNEKNSKKLAKADNTTMEADLCNELVKKREEP
jgi:hypothetical protein